MNLLYHLARPDRNPPRHPHLRLFSGASALPWPQEEGFGIDSPLVRGLHHAACQLVEGMSTGPCWGLTSRRCRNVKHERRAEVDRDDDGDYGKVII